MAYTVERRPGTAAVRIGALWNLVERE